MQVKDRLKQEEKRVLSGFKVTYNDNEFTLTPLYDLTEILGMLYDNVTDVPTDIKAYFRLVIDSNSTTDSIYINLLVGEQL